MKPDKYDGKGSYETFVYQFENQLCLTDKVVTLVIGRNCRSVIRGTERGIAR